MTEATTYTGDDILSALRAAVASAGADTTRQCVYVERAVTDEDRRVWPEFFKNKDSDSEASGDLVGPHCIVGTVLYNLGVSLSTLAEYEGQTSNDMKNGYNVRLHKQYPPIGINITAAGWDILREAQDIQDGSHNWGEALKGAEALNNLRHYQTD